MVVVGGFSASSTKLASVRTTRSTFSRKALTVNLANLTVRVSNRLYIKKNRLYQHQLNHVGGVIANTARNTPIIVAEGNIMRIQEQKTYAISLFPSTLNSRFTAWGCSSLSTSITCFAIDACSGDANGTSTLLYGRKNLVRKWDYSTVRQRVFLCNLHGVPIQC